ncbi:MAG: transporter substrate-binding domain-containing protein [Candidatus Micrarchaeota archaeon]
MKLFEPHVIGILVILALAASVAALAVASQGQGAAVEASTFARIISSGRVNVCYITYPPMIIKDGATGTLKGHFYDAFEEIARDASLKPEYLETTWSNWVSELQSGRCDVSIAPTFATTARATAVAFAKPLLYAGNSAIVRKGDGRFNSISDFNRKNVTIAVAEGEASHAFAKTHLPDAQLKVLSTASGGDLSLPFLEVSAGRADAGLSDSYSVAKYAESHAGVTDLFAARPYGLTALSWAVRTDDVELLNFLNTAISQLESSGTLVELERKYDAHWLHPDVSWSTS